MESSKRKGSRRPVNARNCGSHGRQTVGVGLSSPTLWRAWLPPYSLSAGFLSAGFVLDFSTGLAGVLIVPVPDLSVVVAVGPSLGPRALLVGRNITAARHSNIQKMAAPIVIRVNTSPALA